ncbi:hypothetical protein AALO_G00301340 [Alosa alosa]|uniref:Ciliary neurotrophic factor n=1 Tax=Alosa alosa TaxID=278164 RepID=A0AAV6FIU2_9TELE|nr:hypothetical protein AALO_G00301340 [Alosa alosa]
MEGQEDPQPTGQGSPATRKAVDLARLIKEDCSRLLELYKERETFPENKTSEGGPHLVSVAAISSPDVLTTVERVWHHRCALRRCLELLERQIVWEEEEMGEGGGEYEEVRQAVKVRLGHLLHSTRVLLEAEDVDQGSDHLSPDHDCTQGTEEVDSSNTMNMKIWTHHLLQDLIHWTDSAMKTLHIFHMERTGQQEQQEL